MCLMCLRVCMCLSAYVCACVCVCVCVCPSVACMECVEDLCESDTVPQLGDGPHGAH